MWDHWVCASYQQNYGCFIVVVHSVMAEAPTQLRWPVLHQVLFHRSWMCYSSALSVCFIIDKVFGTVWQQWYSVAVTDSITKQNCAYNWQTICRPRTAYTAHCTSTYKPNLFDFYCRRFDFLFVIYEFYLCLSAVKFYWCLILSDPFFLRVCCTNEFADRNAECVYLSIEFRRPISYGTQVNQALARRAVLRRLEEHFPLTFTAFSLCWLKYGVNFVNICCLSNPNQHTKVQSNK